MEQVHTLSESRTKTRTGSAQGPAAMEQVHTLAEGGEMPGQGQGKHLQLWNKSTHFLRVEKGQAKVSTSICNYRTSPHTS
jgi:hypothetical protein